MTKLIKYEQAGHSGSNNLLINKFVYKSYGIGIGVILLYVGHSGKTR